MIFKNELSDQEMDEIFQNGFDDFGMGFKLSDNPWSNSNPVAAQVWEDGWLDAEDCAIADILDNNP